MILNLEINGAPKTIGNPTASPHVKMSATSIKPSQN